MQDLIGKAARALMKAKYAIALTGAGISTESGIPDFRGPSGVWTKDPDAERRAYQSYGRFQSNPGQYWEERMTNPSVLGDLHKVKPNPGHYALAELEKLGILKWVITQNVDNLHARAGNEHVLDYHGNVFKLRCPACAARYFTDEYDLTQLREEGRLPPLCKSCGRPVKIDTVHFGEPIPYDIASRSIEEAERCDLMLICGTSAVIYPFAELPRISRGRPNVTIIEVNAEPTPLTSDGVSDYLIRGETGQVLPAIVAAVKKLRV
ncbi:NAD-dependent deacetylase [Chloroflexota bacterium]